MRLSRALLAVAVVTIPVVSFAQKGDLTHVICMNRTHFLNDWMFGFVNVTGQ